MKNPVEISLREFNEKCQEEGLEPFPFDKFTIDVIDKSHLELSIKNIQNHLQEWSLKQVFNK